MSCTRTTPWNSSPVGTPSTTVMLTVASLGVRRVMVPMIWRVRKVQDGSGSDRLEGRWTAGTYERVGLRDETGRVVRSHANRLQYVQGPSGREDRGQVQS